MADIDSSSPQAQQAPPQNGQEDDPQAYLFASSKNVWDQYLQYRPSYPDSMWHMWLDYHRGPLSTIHEIGTGCGIGSASLLRVAKLRGTGTVQQAILSDPSASNIATSKELLACAPEITTGTSFTYVTKPAEEPFLPPGSVDMVFACECLHWTRIEESLAKMHESLRPGGTMAAVFYDVAGDIFRDNPRASKALGAVYEDMIVGVREGRHQSKWGKSMEPWQRRNTHLGLNFVPFCGDQWEDVRRVYINLPQEGQTEWPVFDTYRAQGVVKEGDSKVNIQGGETCEWSQDLDGWGMRDCTPEWVKGMLGTAPIEFNEDFWEGEIWREFVDAVQAKGDTFQAVFTTNYVMARKR